MHLLARPEEARGAMKEATLKEPWEREGRKRGGRGEKQARGPEGLWKVAMEATLNSLGEREGRGERRQP